VWPWDIVRMYVVLLTELRWRRNSTGKVGDFPLGEGAGFVTRRVKTGCRRPPRVRWRELSSVFKKDSGQTEEGSVGACCKCHNSLCGGLLVLWSRKLCCVSL